MHYIILCIYLKCMLTLTLCYCFRAPGNYSFCNDADFDYFEFALNIIINVTDMEHSADGN